MRAADDARLCGRACAASSIAMRMRWMEEEKQLKKSFFLRLREDFVEARADGAFAGRVAGAVDVGGVLQQAEDALLAEFGEGLQVEGLGVGRGEIDLEVAGVDDDADGSVDGERDAVDQRVRDADGHDGEWRRG